MAKAVGHAGASWVQRGEASAHVDYTGQVRVFRQAPCYIPPGVLAVWPSYCPPPPRVSVLYPKLEGRGKVRAGHSGSVRRQIQAQAQGPGGVLGAQGTPTPRLSSMLTALAPESQPWRLQTPDLRIPCLMSLQHLFGSHTRQAGSAALPLTRHGCPGHCGDKQNLPGTLNRWCRF